MVGDGKLHGGRKRIGLGVFVICGPAARLCSRSVTQCEVSVISNGPRSRLLRSVFPFCRLCRQQMKVSGTGLRNIQVKWPGMTLTDCAWT